MKTAHMRINKPRRWPWVVSIIGAAICLILVIHHFFFKAAPELPFKTQKPERKTIEQIIRTAGTLEIEGIIKVGSLVAGTLEKLYAKENDVVKKGQVLALIDNGKKDTEVRAAQGILEHAQATYEYQKEFYARQTVLYNIDQLSKDTYQKYTSDLQAAKADVFTAQATLEEKQIEFNNTYIKAPADGIITDLGITQGERVQTDLEASVLFYIAKDVTKMEGILEIDESDMGQIKEGQEVHYTVDTYVGLTFNGIIKKINYSPVTKNNSKYYKAVVTVDNSQQLFRPGMTIHATISVAKAPTSLALTNQAFQIEKESIEKLAKILHYECKPLDDETKKQTIKNELGSNKISQQTKFVWVVKDKTFIEKAVVLSITDNIHFQVLSGITENDEVIIDIEETDEMEKLYKTWFAGAL